MDNPIVFGKQIDYKPKKMDKQEKYKRLHQDIYNCSICHSFGKEVHRVQPKWDENRRPRQIEKWGLIIGQAPGLIEKKKSDSIQNTTGSKEKIPFSGKAGIQLKNWFTESGVDYKLIFEDCLVTALTKCYTGKIKSNDRKPSAIEIKLCEPFLLRQIILVNPKLIIPMGKQAIDWFFPKENKKPVSEMIGHLRKWEDYDVVCLPHPSPASAITKKVDILEKISISIKLLNKHWEKWNLA